MDIKKIEALLIPLKNKGYIKIGVAEGEYGNLEVLLIHRDWETFSIKHVEQALKDIPKEIQKERQITLELPTLDMYLYERLGGPDHKILFEENQ